MIAHPTNDNLVVVSTRYNVLIVDATTLLTVSMIEGEENILDITMCGDGTKCVVTTGSSCEVYDITNIERIMTITTCEMEGELFSSDIYSDGSKVVCGSDKGVVWYDIATSQTTITLREEPSTWARLLCGCSGNTQRTTAQPPTTLSEDRTYFVRFVYEPEGVLYLNGDDARVHLMDMNGVMLREFSGQHYKRSPTIINNNRWLVTGNVDDQAMHIHDLTTGETVHKFYHPSSGGFDNFVYQSDKNTLIGVNYNSTIFVLAAKTAH